MHLCIMDFFESPYCIVISAYMYMLIHLNYIDKQKLMNTTPGCPEIYVGEYNKYFQSIEQIRFNLRNLLS